ncbi:hypothetical protein [uncultured Methanospirillum sp.]|uniref:hypothetical protein n=1 Tax=uncultured Methanospirillum sp. TaxID=262503 RepID=UPI0029C74F64|nr:hypothetical protein [uncultured Methanospirillum sp.]
MERFKTPLFPLEFSRVQIVSKGADNEPGSVDESVYREKKFLKRLVIVKTQITESAER